MSSNGRPLHKSSWRPGDKNLSGCWSTEGKSEVGEQMYHLYIIIYICLSWEKMESFKHAQMFDDF